MFTVALLGESRDVLVDYIRKCSHPSGCLYECSLCGHQNSLRNNVLNHVESQHFPNTLISLFTIISLQPQHLHKHSRTAATAGMARTVWTDETTGTAVMVGMRGAAGVAGIPKYVPCQSDQQKHFF